MLVLGLRKACLKVPHKDVLETAAHLSQSFLAFNAWLPTGLMGSREDSAKSLLQCKIW